MRSAIKELSEQPASGQMAVDKIEVLAQHDGKPAANALLDAAETLAGMGAPIVEKRRKVLLGAGGSGRLKRSRYELRGIEDASEAVAATLAQLKSAAALQVMLKRMTDRGSSIPLWLRLRLATRIAELPEDQMNWRRQAGRKHDLNTLIALMDAAAGLGNRAGDACGKWLAKLLVHKNVDVRIRAAATMGRLAWPAGIELLIARLDREKGAVHDAVLDALCVLTAQNPGNSAGSWRAWLAAEGGPYVRGEKELRKGKPRSLDKKSSGKTVSGSYFGIAQTGESILYVFDNSLSMKAKLGKKGKNQKAPTTGPAPETRWDLCRIELRRALRGLRAGQKFNLVSFANKPRCYAPTMQEVTPENIEKAILWLNGLKLEFQTNVYDALELGFMIAGRGLFDKYYASEVDTLFFLSDGAPTIPNLEKAGISQDDPLRILAAVRRWNALGRVTIHTVGIGLQNRNRPNNKNNNRNRQRRLPPPKFLEKLAAENGGRAVMRRN